MIRYLIIDDEHIAHDIIKGYCDMLPAMKLEKNCYDALEALEYLRMKDVELIFLDLNMPKLKGFDFLKTLTNPPRVIVTTAYSEFALEGYELNVVDYLLKPFSFERFLKAVNKAIGPPTKLPTSGNKKEKTETVSRIFLKSDKKYIQLILDEIQYIEASGNYTKVVTVSETITTREKFSNVLTTLPDRDFLQVHKSFAVAPHHIKSIEGNQITIGNVKIPIGRLFKLNVNSLLG